MKKKKFEITKSFIIKTALFALLGILAFVVGWTDVEFLSILTVVFTFAFGISLLFGANFLLLKNWRALLISLLVFVVSLVGLKISYIMNWQLSTTSEFFEGLIFLFLIFAWGESFIGIFYSIKKRNFWLAGGCFILFLIPFILGFCLPNIVCDRILMVFRHARSIIFITLMFLILGQAILGFIWKPAQKWGLLVFYMVLGIITAITGQVLDYIAQHNTPQRAVEVVGRSFGDYGLRDSLYDQDESYRNDTKKYKPRQDNRMITKYGIGVSRLDRDNSYTNNKGE
ncbi:MAG: hypothetical protein IKS41_00305 [Alphaproteobacteria bacterium]|nr:hypothetical protein [Alphaproteobacteria bacterium]